MANMIIQEQDGVDLITHLPEDIISNILSRLPITDAVRTSVMSRAWEHKWKCVSNVQIVDSDSHDEDTLAKFVNFVQRVVGQTRNVTSFCLLNRANYHDTWQFSVLIGGILKHPVKSLDLCLSPYNAVILPRNLIQNTSLENLELRFKCILRVPGTATFPVLKRLDLSDAVIENNSGNDTMKLYLPLLEIIELNFCTVRNVTTMEIHAPVLTTFHSTDPVDEDYLIKIISNQRVVFRLDHYNKIHKTNDEFIIERQQVVQAELNYHRDYGVEVDDENGEHLHNMFTLYLSNVRELTMSGELVMFMANSIEGFTLPMLHRLVRLNVNNNYEEDLLPKGLLNLLCKTPWLKYLSIACYGMEYDYTPAEYVPMCMKYNLEEIEFKLDLNWAERGPLHLLNYLVKNGTALKRTYIRSYNRIPEYIRSHNVIPVDEVTQYLLAIPRSSTGLLDVQVI